MADTGVPTRTAPIPSEDAVLPSKKAEQAKLFRIAAESLERESRKELEGLQHFIQKKVLELGFSSSQFHVKATQVSFMESGTNLVMQVTFSYREK
jgi:hypothetical protein